MSGQIIILNGAPRSGKTSIARAVQERFDGVWINLGVDVYEQATPARYRPGIGLRLGGERPDLEALVPGFHAGRIDRRPQPAGAECRGGCRPSRCLFEATSHCGRLRAPACRSAGAVCRCSLPAGNHHGKACSQRGRQGICNRLIRCSRAAARASVARRGPPARRVRSGDRYLAPQPWAMRGYDRREASASTVSNSVSETIQPIQRGP